MILDVIIPIFNNEKQIQNIFNKISEELKNIKYNIIFIDDASTDKSMQILKEIYKNNETSTKIISFSKSFGKDACIYAGLLHSFHDAVCIYDLELQANISHISKMYDFLSNNTEYDQVCMYSNTDKNNKKVNLFNKIFNTNIDLNKTYFRLFKKNYKLSLIEYSKINKFTKQAFDEIGFNTYYLKFDCKNNIKNINLKKYLCYSKKPFNFTKVINFTFIIIIFILLIFTLLKIINISNNGLVLIILILSLLMINISTFNVNYLLKSNERTNFYIKEKIGFDENVL